MWPFKRNSKISSVVIAHFYSVDSGVEITVTEEKLSNRHVKRYQVKTKFDGEYEKVEPNILRTMAMESFESKCIIHVHNYGG
jgi:hypothetical protein